MNDNKKNHTLLAARSVFLRYGFKRVSMNDLAEAAGVSRPALYLLFKNKEEIFVSVYRQWVNEVVAEIQGAMSAVAAPQEQIERAFEIWAVGPFELVTTLPDAHELVECSLGFAQAAQREGYAQFEATIVPVLGRMNNQLALPPERVAHLLSSAVRGFKQTATTSDELRQLIKEHSLLCLGVSARTPSMA